MTSSLPADFWHKNRTYVHTYTFIRTYLHTIPCMFSGQSLIDARMYVVGFCGYVNVNYWYWNWKCTMHFQWMWKHIPLVPLGFFLEEDWWPLYGCQTGLVKSLVSDSGGTQREWEAAHWRLWLGCRQWPERVGHACCSLTRLQLAHGWERGMVWQKREIPCLMNKHSVFTYVRM